MLTAKMLRDNSSIMPSIFQIWVKKKVHICFKKGCKKIHQNMNSAHWSGGIPDALIFFVLFWSSKFLITKKASYFYHISLPKSSAHEHASLGDLPEHRWLGPTRSVWSVGLGGARESAFLTRSQVLLLRLLLLVQGAHFENHALY